MQRAVDDGNQAVAIRVGKAAQQDRIHCTEYGCVGTNPESKSNDRYESKSRVLPEPTRGVAKVPRASRRSEPKSFLTFPAY